jgi:predicted phosphodiesterase
MTIKPKSITINKIAFFYKIIYLTAFFLTVPGILQYSYAQSQTFAVIGDFGNDNGHETAVANLVDSWNPAFVFTVGDNTYHSDYSRDVGQYYHQYIFPHDPIYEQSSDPSSNHFWPVIGNHDYINSSYQDYTDYFVLPQNANNNERYYTKQIGDIEFFAINSDSHEPDGTSKTSQQAQWIHQQISNSTALWKIVLFHHPAYSSSGSFANMRWPFKDWGVDAVISGHRHNYERILINNLVYFVDGLGGDSKVGFNSTVAGSQKRYNSDYGALKVTESEDGTTSYLTFQFYNTSGTRIDNYQLQKPIPLPVELISFNAHPIDNSTIKLSWSTSTEVNNYGFDIERSNSNTNNGWEKIGFVVGSGNSNSPKNYSFTDSPTNGTSFSYRLKQIDIGGAFKYYDPISISLAVSDKPQLLQNSPNPFNPSTTIKFYIPNTSDVSIKIYDVLGREVTTLINQQTTAGYHVVNWNSKDSRGENVASGIYLYRLTAGSFSQTKKMNLLK